MIDFAILQQLGVALVLSSLIGLEREHRYQSENVPSFGGLRTFALIGLAGALAYIMGQYYQPLFAVVTAGFLALVVAAYVMTTRDEKEFGATSEVAAILVYIIGILAAMGLNVVATAVALAVLVILHFRDPLHSWAKHIRNEELVSTIEFVVIAFVVLPLLPNQAYGPYEFFNPYVVWLMVVFISGISFASYIAIKLFGARRGISLTGFLAGFISSTALAFSFSAKSKKVTKVVNPFVLAMVVAASAMFFRVLVEVAVLNRSLFFVVLPPLLVMGVVAAVIAIFFYTRKEKMSAELGRDALDLKSPFSLRPALKFAVFFAFILFLTKFAQVQMGSSGIYLASLISGILDVDAITISVSNLAKNGLAEDVAAAAVVIAVIVNTLSKAVIFMIFGNKAVSLRVFASFLFVLLCGGATFLFF